MSASQLTAAEDAAMDLMVVVAEALEDGQLTERERQRIEMRATTLHREVRMARAFDRAADSVKRSGRVSRQVLIEFADVFQPGMK